MSKWKTYKDTQPLHCCGRDDLRNDKPASVMLREMDGGGGSYMVIDIDSWSVDSRDELKKLTKVMKKFLRKIEANNG